MHRTVLLLTSCGDASNIKLTRVDMSDVVRALTQTLTAGGAQRRFGPPPQGPRESAATLALM